MEYDVKGFHGPLVEHWHMEYSVIFFKKSLFIDKEEEIEC